MKKIFTLLTSTFLLVGCVESIALLGGGAVNGKLAQSSLQTAGSYVVKKNTGKTPIKHALSYVDKKKKREQKKSCSSFTNEKDLEICLMAEQRLISKQTKPKEEKFTDKTSKNFISSLKSSINEKSKIKYLD